MIFNIVGWMFDIPPLKRPFAVRPELEQPACGIGPLMIVTALLLTSMTPSTNAFCRNLARVLALVAASAALANLIEFFSGRDLCLVQTLWEPSDGALGLRFPGPLAPDSACFILVLALGVLLYGVAIRESSARISI